MTTFCHPRSTPYTYLTNSLFRFTKLSTTVYLRRVCYSIELHRSSECFTSRSLAPEDKCCHRCSLSRQVLAFDTNIFYRLILWFIRHVTERKHKFCIKFSVNLLKSTIIFNRRDIGDHITKKLFYTCFRFSTTQCHLNGANDTDPMKP